MIYIPIKNENEFIVPFPKKNPKKPESLNVRLGIVEYLSAYGLKVSRADCLDRNRLRAEGRWGMSEWIAANYCQLSDLLRHLNSRLWDKRDKKKAPVSMNYPCRNRFEEEFLERCGFVKEGDAYTHTLDKSQTVFLTGGWLEEYCFNVAASLIGRGIDDAVIGIPIKSAAGTDNEFDVMFTSGNTLYTIECKSLDQAHDPSADVLYKIGALQKDFGLRCESLLVTTSPHILDGEGKLKLHIAARAEQFRTEIVPPAKVVYLKDILLKKLNLPGGGL